MAGASARRSRGLGRGYGSGRGRAAGLLFAGLAAAAVLLGGVALPRGAAAASSSEALWDPESGMRKLQADPVSAPATDPCSVYNDAGLTAKRRKKQCKKDPACYYDAGENGKCSVAVDDGCDGLQTKKKCSNGGCRWIKKKLDPAVPGQERGVANYPFCVPKGGPGPKGTNAIVLERAGLRFKPPGNAWGEVCQYSVGVRKVRDLMDIPPGGLYTNIEWNKVKKAYNKFLAPLLAPGGALSLTKEEEEGSAYIRSAQELYGVDFLNAWTFNGLDGTSTGTAPENSEARRQIVEKSILDWQTARLTAGWAVTLEKYGLGSQQGQDALGKMAALWTGCGDANRKGGPRHAMWKRADLRGQPYSFASQVGNGRTGQAVAGTNAAVVEIFGQKLPPAGDADASAKAASTSKDVVTNQLMTVQSQCVVRYSTKLDKDTEAWLKAGNSFGPPAQINNAAVFNATMRKNQSEGDTFFKVVRPQMQLSRGDGTVPGTAGVGFKDASVEIARVYEIRGPPGPHMPNPPASPNNYCYIVNALTAWLKTGVGGGKVWGEFFGLLADKGTGLKGAGYCGREYPTAGAGGVPWPDPSWWCVPEFTCPKNATQTSP